MILNQAAEFARELEDQGLEVGAEEEMLGARFAARKRADRSGGNS